MKGRRARQVVWKLKGVSSGDLLFRPALEIKMELTQHREGVFLAENKIGAELKLSKEEPVNREPTTQLGGTYTVLRHGRGLTFSLHQHALILHFAGQNKVETLDRFPIPLQEPNVSSVCPRTEESVEFSHEGQGLMGRPPCSDPVGLPQGVALIVQAIQFGVGDLARDAR